MVELCILAEVIAGGVVVHQTGDIGVREVTKVDMLTVFSDTGVPPSLVKADAFIRGASFGIDSAIPVVLTMGDETEIGTGIVQPVAVDMIDQPMTFGLENGTVHHDISALPGDGFGT